MVPIWLLFLNKTAVSMGYQQEKPSQDYYMIFLFVLATLCLFND